MDLVPSPTYHYISPLARSRSEARGAKSVRRSYSFTQGSGASSFGSAALTMPQYGYGGGYMSKSLLRSCTFRNSKLILVSKSFFLILIFKKYYYYLKFALSFRIFLINLKKKLNILIKNKIN